jgi:glucose/arabinose dehydrogenase
MTRCVSALLAAGAIVGPAWAQDPVPQGEKNVPEFAPAFAEQTRAPAVESGIDLAVDVVADGLANPWGLAQLPDGAILVTERPGRMRVIDPDGTVGDPIAGLPDVHAERQGGLLDVELGPSFADDRLIYWTYAKPMGNGLSSTAAARGRLADDYTELTEVEDIFVQQPPSPVPMHYGSRVVFDGDGHVFITTGEHSREDQRGRAQDVSTGYGKVIRIRLDGSAPPDNPFVGDPDALPEVWSYGHRNIQGAAIHPETGLLWTVEHGPKGGDELNVPGAGLNYGWPLISYGENYNGSPIGDGLTSALGMEEPTYYWDPVIAPAGMAFYEGELFEGWRGDLLIAALNPGGLHRLELADDSTSGMTRVIGEERLLTDQGRIRDVAEAPDGSLLVLTDAGDGALLRLTPASGRTN